MSDAKANSNLMIVCDDKDALQGVLRIAGMFGLSAANASKPILEVGQRQIAVLQSSEDMIGGNIVEKLCDDVQKLYHVNPFVSLGNGVPTMNIMLH